VFYPLTYCILQLRIVLLYIFVVYVLFHLNFDADSHNTYNKRMMCTSDNRKWLGVVCQLNNIHYQFHPNLIVHVLYDPNFDEFFFHIKHIVMNYIVHNKMLLWMMFQHHMLHNLKMTSCEKLCITALKDR